MHQQRRSNENCENLITFVDSMMAVLDEATVDMFAFIDSLDSGRVISFATDSPPTNLLPESILCVHDIGSLEDASLGSGLVSDAKSAFGSGQDALLGSGKASDGSFLQIGSSQRIPLVPCFILRNNVDMLPPATGPPDYLRPFFGQSPTIDTKPSIDPNSDPTAPAQGTSAKPIINHLHLVDSKWYTHPSSTPSSSDLPFDKFFFDEHFFPIEILATDAPT
jgi:hypothetical protein